MIKHAYLATLFARSGPCRAHAAQRPSARAPHRAAPAPARRRPDDRLRGRLLRPVRAAHRARHRSSACRASRSTSAARRPTGQVDVRGFAGTAGNVVINGARPSTKAETLDVTLARIPAQRVRSGRARPRRPLRLRLCRQEPGAQHRHVGARRLRRQRHRVRRSAGSPATSTPTSRARRSIRRGASTINLSGGTGRNRQLEEGTGHRHRRR